MEQNEKSQKVLAAERKVAEAKAMLNRAKKEESRKIRSIQNAKKYTMGGMIVKYFPECYDFSNEELLRIIACAFSLPDVKNMIKNVVKERPKSSINNSEMEGEKIDAE